LINVLSSFIVKKVDETFPSEHLYVVEFLVCYS